MSEAPSELRQQSESPRDAAISIDLYCLDCGYNLRGLSGDPVRCPECGYRNPVGDIELPADQIRKQFQRMETAPAVSVLGLLFLIPLLLFWCEIVAEGGRLSANEMACPGIATAVAATAWVAGIVHFRSTCLGRPGWLAALVWYQFVALLLVGLVCAAYAAAFHVAKAVGGSLWTDRGQATFLIVMPLTLVLVITGIRWGLRPLHARLKAPMERLQRQVTVKIARERIRRELRRQRRPQGLGDTGL